VAAELERAGGMNVSVIDGDKGEFTVLVDGHEVLRKGDELPSADEVVTAVGCALTA
jgi:hypothetical protein